ncbi:Transcriptional regulator, HxlR family [uncultured Rubrobacteraceae bacterium]|uniref:Transcriptional regulator, HxlR family n=1 Tax=uncultured Rubrobacteraceae bacterium TaxID=349277 RepID=A0A6J4PMQ4_9ACTN|nr:Transcriptional regulator, HxlR family [uncultured Rubrobacteraceae bacterium]
MGEKRSYGQHCTVARALDVVGGRWTLLLVRELSTGPKRFKDLLGGLPGIGTNLLAGRLKALEGEGIVRRATLPPPAGSSVYELTGLGRSLEPVLVALSRWGASFMEAPREGENLRAGWAAVAMRSALGAGATRSGTYELRIDGEAFHLRVWDGGEVEARQGSAPETDLVLTGDAGTFLAVAAGRMDPDEAVTSGALRIEGEREKDREALLAHYRRPVVPTAD